MPEEIIDLPFPTKGIDRGTPASEQPPLTTHDLLNVRAVHFGDRTGGGKRGGTKKSFVEQIGSGQLGFRVNHLQLLRTAQGRSGCVPASWVTPGVGLDNDGYFLIGYNPLTLAHVFGNFTLAGNATAERFARFNTLPANLAGTWTAPADSFSTSMVQPCRAKRFNDGNGEKLYAVGGKGTSPTMGGFQRWNGSTWQNLAGSGFAGGNAVPHSIEILSAAGLGGPIEPELDTEVPTITIQVPPPPEAETSNNPVTISGIATDNIGIDRVEWLNTNTGGRGFASGTTSWTADVPLAECDNPIVFTAFDEAENSASALIVITLVPATDTTPPTIEIKTPTTAETWTTTTTPIQIAGVAADDVAVTSVAVINNQTGNGYLATGTEDWSAFVDLVPGTQLLIARASDAAGNFTDDWISVTLGVPDIVKPTITIISPTQNQTYTTSTNPLPLAGTASDDVGVDNVVWINNQTGNGALATGTTDWTASVPLIPGDQLIIMRAYDADGDFGEDTVLVTYVPGRGDTQSPTVVITSPTSSPSYTTTSPTVTISGTAVDDVGVITVTWKNLAAGSSGTATGTGHFTQLVFLLVGMNEIIFTAYDAAGNLGTDTIFVNYKVEDTTAPVVNITSPTTNATYTTSSTPLALGGTATDDTAVDNVVWINNQTGNGALATGTDNWTASVPLIPGDQLVIIRAFDAAGNFGDDTIFVTYSPSDTTSPVVTITGPTSNPTHTAATALLTVSGTASDNVAVTLVTWVNAATGGSGSATGTTSWTKDVPLINGVNTIRITAYDAAGNFSTDVLTVTNTLVAADTIDPTVTITIPTANPTFSTTASSIILGGVANDNVAVTSVNWSNALTGASGGATGTTSWQVNPVALNVGVNTITVTVFDAAGNDGTDVITVTRTNLPGNDWTYPIDPPTAPTINHTVNLNNPTVAQIDAAIAAETKIVVTGTVTGGTTRITIDVNDVWLDFSGIPMIGIPGGDNPNVQWTGGVTIGPFIHWTNNAARSRIDNLYFNGRDGALGTRGAIGGIGVDACSDVHLKECAFSHCFVHGFSAATRILLDNTDLDYTWRSPIEPSNNASYVLYISPDVSHVEFKNGCTLAADGPIGVPTFVIRGNVHYMRMIDCTVRGFQDEDRRLIWLYNADHVQFTRTTFTSGSAVWWGVQPPNAGWGAAQQFRMDDCDFVDMTPEPAAKTLEINCNDINFDIKIRNTRWENCRGSRSLGIQAKDAGGQSHDIVWYQDTMTVDGLPMQDSDWYIDTDWTVAEYQQANIGPIYGQSSLTGGNEGGIAGGGGGSGGAELGDVGGIIVAGSFTSVNGVSAASIARYDGAFTALSTGITGGSAIVYAMAMYDGYLYVAGNFTTAGGLASAKIARWNGEAWSIVGDGDEFTDGAIYTLCVWNGILYIGGTFTSVDSNTRHHWITSWNGTEYVPLSIGIESHNPDQLGGVYSIEVYDDGLQEKLYIAGKFNRASNNAAGVSCPNICCWDGLQFLAPKRGFNRTIWHLVGIGNELKVQLWAAGAFGGSGAKRNVICMNGIGAWDGSVWHPVGGAGCKDGRNDVAPYKTGLRAARLVNDSRLMLYHGGSFASASVPSDVHGFGPNQIDNALAKWSGSRWEPCGSGIVSGGRVRMLAVHDDGTGEKLYVGGVFTAAGGITTSPNFMAYNGSEWEACGTGVSSGTNAPDTAFSIAGDGDLDGLYVGGGFAAMGGVANTNLIARWNGIGGWTSLWSGSWSASARVYALGRWKDDQTGTVWLVVGGKFTTIDGAAAENIYVWNTADNDNLYGSSGEGIRKSGNAASAAVYACAVFNEELYVAGDFDEAGGVTCNNIAVLREGAWTFVGNSATNNGTNERINDLIVVNDGTDTRLYAVGTFTTAGSVTRKGIASWDGDQWHRVDGTSAAGITEVGGSGDADVQAIDVYNGRIVIAGKFTYASGQPAFYVARAQCGDQTGLTIGEDPGSFFGGVPGSGGSDGSGGPGDPGSNGSPGSGGPTGGGGPVFEPNDTNRGPPLPEISFAMSGDPGGTTGFYGVVTTRGIRINPNLVDSGGGLSRKGSGSGRDKS